jgi:hypothetical protein
MFPNEIEHGLRMPPLYSGRFRWCGVAARQGQVTKRSQARETGYHQKPDNLILKAGKLALRNIQNSPESGNQRKNQKDNHQKNPRRHDSILWTRLEKSGPQRPNALELLSLSRKANKQDIQFPLPDPTQF